MLGFAMGWVLPPLTLLMELAASAVEASVTVEPKMGSEPLLEAPLDRVGTRIERCQLF
jgi:hypothetical protein